MKYIHVFKDNDEIVVLDKPRYFFNNRIRIMLNVVQQYFSLEFYKIPSGLASLSGGGNSFCRAQDEDMEIRLP